jgi:hypothetical protein
MERPSCVGCLLTSSFLIVFFTTLISVILNRIFKAGAFDEAGTVSLNGAVNLFMAHKTLVATSFIVALLPTFYVAATINDIYVNYKRKREKDVEATLQAYHEQKDQKLYEKTLPKAEHDQIDPLKFKAPSRSLPKNMQTKDEPDDQNAN